MNWYVFTQVFWSVILLAGLGVAILGTVVGAFVLNDWLTAVKKGKRRAPVWFANVISGTIIILLVALALAGGIGYMEAV